MAQNWSLFEGAKAILANDEAAIADLGKRFPLTTVAIASMGNNESAMKIFEALPINVTMRKVEANLKDGVDVDTDAEDSEDETTEEETPKKAKKSDDDKKAAAAARRKARRDAKKAKEVEPEEDEVEEDEVEEDENDYSSMNAIELFKLCKKRGIKAAPKQKAAEYIKLLKAADAESAEEDADDWEDEEEEAPAPKKSKGRPAKTATKKVAEEDEDDDWDI